MFTPLQISPTLRKREAFRVELRNLTYEAQRDIMFFICDRLPRVVGMAFDATGNGGYLAEQAALRYGPAVVEQVSLNLAWYAEWMPKLKGGVRGLQHRAVQAPKHAGRSSLDQGRERHSSDR
nr:hypothetical protein [Pseudomonas aeruginosa]